jgi:hypothetical protein
MERRHCSLAIPIPQSRYPEEIAAASDHQTLSGVDYTSKLAGHA